LFYLFCAIASCAPAGDKGTEYFVEPSPTPLGDFRGEGLVYESNGDIFYYEVGKSSPISQLTQTPEAEHDPVWASDGKSLYFVRDDPAEKGNIYRLRGDSPDLSTWVVERITGDNSGYEGYLWLSTDNRKLFYVASGSLVSFDLDPPQGTSTISDSGYPAFQTSNSDYLFFQRAVSDSTYIVDSAAQALPSIYGKFRSNSATPIVAENDRHGDLLLSAYRDASANDRLLTLKIKPDSPIDSELLVRDINGNVIKSITLEASDGTALQGNGKLAFIRRGHLHVAEADGSNIQEMSSDIRRFEMRPSFSVDGGRIAFFILVSDGSAELWSVKSNRLGAEKWAEGIASTQQRIQWRPPLDNPGN